MGSFCDSGKLKVKKYEYNPGMFNNYLDEIPQIELEWWADDDPRYPFFNAKGEDIIIKRNDTVTIFSNETRCYAYTFIKGTEKFISLNDLPATYKWTESDLEWLTTYQVKVYDLKAKKKKLYQLVEIAPDEEDMTESEIKDYITNSIDGEPEIEIIENKIGG